MRCPRCGLIEHRHFREPALHFLLEAVRKTVALAVQLDTFCAIRKSTPCSSRPPAFGIVALQERELPKPGNVAEARLQAWHKGEFLRGKLRTGANFNDAHSEITVHDDHLSPGNQFSIQYQVSRVLDLAIEFQY